MKTINKKSGSLLLELLIVIGVVAIIVPVIAQVVISSLNVNRWSTENKVAIDLADEVTKAVEGAIFEKWQNVYDMTKGQASHYFTIKSNGAWIINSGDEALNVNNINFTRYFSIFNVCRNTLTRAIIMDPSTPPCPDGSSDDPSTQKITVTVSWKNGTLTKDYYLTRWRNQVCHQTNWSGTSSGTTTCPNTVYESATDIDVNSIPGSLRLQAN